MKHILMIATGGTLACRASENGLCPTLTGQQLLEFLPELTEICQVTVENPFSIDSTDMDSTHRVQLVHIVRDHYAQYDGFVIAHGTDTLAYTAALLYHMMRNLDKPVLITGAQKPIGTPNSDAERNLRDAFRVACSPYVGVAAVLHGQIIAGNRVVKVDCENMNPFRSINAPLHGIIDRQGHIRLDFIPHANGTPTFVEQIHSDFILLKLVPDLDPSILTLLPHYAKVILEGYGSGGIPIQWENAIASLIARGVRVYITTQCLSGCVDLSKYEVGQRAQALGAISLGDRTIEDAIAAIQCGEI